MKMARRLTQSQPTKLQLFIMAKYGIAARQAWAMELAGRGLTNRQMAERAGITPGAVTALLHKVYYKTKATGRLQLIKSLQKIESEFRASTR
jgi:DNA-binding CsgD family transcriptional regulator